MRSTPGLAALIAGLLLVPAQAQVVNGAGQAAARMVRGWVVAVRPGNGAAMLRIRSAQVVNNVGPANAQAVAPVAQTFAIGPGTHFEVARGMNLMPATAAMLRPGQQVLVQAQGQQAMGVRILGHGQYLGRRGGYYAPRGRQVARTNRLAPGLPSTSPPAAARTPTTHFHHASAPGGNAGRVASKKR